MTTYRVYYRDDDGMKLICYVEVPDSTPRQQKAYAKQYAMELHHIREDQIVRIIRDC